MDENSLCVFDESGDDILESAMNGQVYGRMEPDFLNIFFFLGLIDFVVLKWIVTLVGHFSHFDLDLHRAGKRRGWSL
jgi:hypothetical protein